MATPRARLEVDNEETFVLAGPVAQALVDAVHQRLYSAQNLGKRAPEPPRFLPICYQNFTNRGHLSFGSVYKHST